MKILLKLGITDSASCAAGRQLRYLAADIGTNSGASGVSRGDSSLAALAVRVMTVMRDRGAVAFIGPDDTCGAEALVAAAWNLPVISYVSHATAVQFGARRSIHSGLIESVFAIAVGCVDVRPAGRQSSLSGDWLALRVALPGFAGFIER